MRVLVTGATGFVGTHALARLATEGMALVAATRREHARIAGASSVAVGEIGPGTDWRDALAGCDAVLHCAAIAHRLHAAPAAIEPEFERVNVLGTLRLAEQAAGAGVRRFVFVSSIGVLGATDPGRPFGPHDAPAPLEPYARSKWHAEQGLRAIGERTSMQIVIVRPPLVHGAGNPGNALRLMRLVASGVPLPLGAVRAQRSYLGVANLADLLARCLVHPAAAGGAWLAADDEPLALPEVLRLVAQGMGRPCRLVPVPPAWLALAARVAHRHELADKLLGTLRVDASATRHALAWAPPHGARQGWIDAGRWYAAAHPRAR